MRKPVLTGPPCRSRRRSPSAESSRAGECSAAPGREPTRPSPRGPTSPPGRPRDAGICAVVPVTAGSTCPHANELIELYERLGTGVAREQHRDEAEDWPRIRIRFCPMMISVRREFCITCILHPLRSRCADPGVQREAMWVFTMADMRIESTLDLQFRAQLSQFRGERIANRDLHDPRLS